MDIAIIGLGKMGANMARRLIKGGHRVVGVDRAAEAVKNLAEEVGFVPAFSTAEAIAALSAPRVVWVMVPAGELRQPPGRKLCCQVVGHHAQPVWRPRGEERVAING